MVNSVESLASIQIGYKHSSIQISVIINNFLKDINALICAMFRFISKLVWMSIKEILYPIENYFLYDLTGNASGL